MLQNKLESEETSKRRGGRRKIIISSCGMFLLLVVSCRISLKLTGTSNSSKSLICWKKWSAVLTYDRLTVASQGVQLLPQHGADQEVLQHSQLSEIVFHLIQFFMLLHFESKDL